MNTVIETLLQHKSIRSFKDQDIDQEILETILNAAMRTSSSGNMQAYSIIVTKDQKMKEKLYAPHFEQQMVLEAPVFITFCADFNRMRKWLDISNAPDNFDNFMSFMIASIDATLASQSAAIAAESLGLGLCYLGTTLASSAEIAGILDCPKNVVPVVGFALGYPDEDPEVRERMPFDSLVHYETYKDYDEVQILQAYVEKEKKSMQRYKTIPKLKEMIKEQNVRNLAQVYTKVKYTKESHENYSRNLLDFLEQQNFYQKEFNLNWAPY